MTTNRPLRVFLCHSSADKPAVRELYQKLRAEPWIQPWLDEEELFPGMDWNLEIEKAVEESDIVLVCLSNNSITKRGFIQKELRFVVDIALEIPEEELFIIPLRFEECTPPRSLREWQYADYFEGNRERAYQRLIVSLYTRADSLGLVTQIQPIGFVQKILKNKSLPSEEWKVREPDPEISDRYSHTYCDHRKLNGEWYICGASRRGKSHEHEAMFREDAFRIKEAAGWVLVAVADGSSSHHLSRVGANLAVETAIELMKNNVERYPPNQKGTLFALEEALRESWLALFKEAGRRKTEFQNLSTTLLLLMYYPRKNLIGVAQVGDGLIAGQLEDRQLSILGHPESGKYSGQTYFLTNLKLDELPSKCGTLESPVPIRYFFVMTDGIADDLLYTPQERLPSLIKAIPEVMANQHPDDGLLELINYDQSNSFGDRTLVVVCKRSDLSDLPPPPSGFQVVL